MSDTPHATGFITHCVTPETSRAWKVGQLWQCRCLNIFRLTQYHGWGDTFNTWDFIGNFNLPKEESAT